MGGQFHILRCPTNSLRLYLADCCLEGCRLGVAQGDGERAEGELAEAERLIEEMGYHRRDGEVEELRRRLGKENYE